MGDDLCWLQVRVWDTNSLVCLATLQGHSGAVRALAASPTRVFSGSDDTTIKVPGSRLCILGMATIYRGMSVMYCWEWASGG